ncbi:pyridoxamine 5'-phosphate oxidase family protein [Eubacteriales bacterium OttesenSCG-928-A19]|nr:pyridoxamine 5'-phosphate oxidase family protein [Eubacteriales bacterium OttesenSCG-928-A19]
MNKITEIVNYLKEANVMYLASTKENKPKVRPIGFVMEYNGAAYFTTGEGGPIFSELRVNPYFEIAAMHPNKPFYRIRFSGKAVFDADVAAFEMYYNLNPEMKNAPNTTLFRAEQWEATIYEGVQDRRILKQ